MRRSPEYGHAIAGLQQNGHPLNPAPDSGTDRLAVGLALAARQNKVQISGVDFGNTIVNGQGAPDRNVFYGGQNNSDLRISGQQTINASVVDQVTKANQQRTQDASQAAPERQLDQQQNPEALRQRM